MLPEKPVKLLESDCCGNGCAPCVLDIYAEELAIWERECARISPGDTSTATRNRKGEAYMSPALSKIEYHQYQITSIIQETCNTWRFTCQLGHDQSLGLLPGQHVVIRGCREGQSISHQYTPVSDVTEKGAFQLLIKIYKNGRMSQVVDCWQVGDWIDIRGPFGSLQYTPNEYNKVLMLAAGTGIAPMAQLLHTVMTNENEEGHFRLLFACRTYDDVLMKTELTEWQQFWNFSVVFVLSQEPLQTPAENCYRYGDTIVRGRIDKTMVQRELGEHYNSTRVLVCGTWSFDAAVLQILKECHFPKENIFKF